MSDLINQAKEYADLSEVVTTTFYDDENEEWSIRSTTIGDVLDTVCDDYTVFPSTQQWIPVTEWLPEKYQYVLVTYKGLDGRRLVVVTNWNPNAWVESNSVAWMPVPEPYQSEPRKGEENDK